MSWTTQDLQKLNEAIATGARKVRYADKEVEYRSLAEMFQIKNEMEKQLGLSAPKYILPTFSKGYDNCGPEHEEH